MYNADGNLTQSIDPDGNITLYTHDVDGREVTSKGGSKGEMPICSLSIRHVPFASLLFPHLRWAGRDALIRPVAGR
jgi:YD repeat-containing protein